MYQKRKTTLKFIAFLVGLYIILLAASFVFIPKDNKQERGASATYTQSILSEKENTLDIIFLGDSESYSVLSPMELWGNHGYTSYICGSAAQPLYDTYNNLVSAFEKQTPKLVVLETNAVFTSNGVLKDLAKAFDKTGKVLMPIFEYHNRWKNLKLEDFTRVPKYTYTNDLKGFIYSSDVDPWTGNNYMVTTQKRHKMPPVSKYYVEQIRNLCEEKEVSFLMVSVPSSANWNYAKHISIKNYAEEKAIPFLDLNYKVDELEIDWRVDTKDKGDHLNFSGARKVMTYFGNYLSENYTIPDHRDEIEFQNWNDSLLVYKKLVGDIK